MLHLPSTTALQCFEAAARHLSVSQSANELHLTQSAVSRQIKNLEKFLDTRLFERSRQRLQLTDSGRFYLQAITPMLLQLSEVTQQFRGSSQRLRVAAEPAFASRWLIPRLSDLKQQYPDIEIEVLTDNEPLQHLDGFDIAVVYNRPDSPGFNCEALMPELLVAVCTPKLLGNNGPFANYEDITQYPLIHHSDRESSTDMWLSEAKLESRHLPGQRFDRFSLLIDAVKQNMGITVVPYFFVEEDLNNGSLVLACKQHLLTDAYYHLVIAEEKLGSVLIEQFRQWLLKHNRKQCQISP